METTLESGKFLDPKALIGQIGINWGSTVADFGCGSGYFSIALAEAIGGEGKVYSLDILPQSLESVTSRAKTLGLTNIIAKRVNLEKDGGSKLGPESLDWVIMKDMLFQNKNKEVIIKEAYRVLKPGGMTLIVEWDAGNQGVGPDSELRISREDLKKIGESQKFILEKEPEAGDFHYALVFKK